MEFILLSPRSGLYKVKSESCCQWVSVLLLLVEFTEPYYFGVFLLLVPIGIGSTLIVCRGLPYS